MTLWPSNEHKNFCFENEEDVHTSSQNYEKSDKLHDLDLLTLSFTNYVFHILREVS